MRGKRVHMARFAGILGLALIALLMLSAKVARAETGTPAANQSQHDDLVARYFETSSRPKQDVPAAINEAARLTGTDYRFLVAKARLESGLDANAKAPTSSAAGLFQFIEGTWIASFERYGADFGLTAEAEARASDSSVDPSAKGHALSRAAILELRYNPRIAALMAAASARDNAAVLRTALGRRPTHTELYMAHFLGSAGAARFIRAWQRDPTLLAAPLFPKAARANRSIFFVNGKARTVDALIQHFDAKIQSAMPQDAFADKEMPNEGADEYFVPFKQITEVRSSSHFPRHAAAPFEPSGAATDRRRGALGDEVSRAFPQRSLQTQPLMSELVSATASHEAMQQGLAKSLSFTNAISDAPSLDFTTMILDTKATIVSGIGVKPAGLT